MVRFWKERYCEAGYHGCMRYRRMTRGQPVPLTLLPSGAHLKVLPPGPAGGSGRS